VEVHLALWAANSHPLPDRLEQLIFEGDAAMTFYEWWDHGCRAGEKEPHKFAADCPSDAWLAKEAWDAALLKDSAKTPLCCQAADKINYEKGLGLTKCPICYGEI
jgi:hypothetical protein